ncbi:MAG: lysoplasmalogenase [Bacteroidales bacterium]|nr:lysoplasmalogenase [Bacteroidales bacterium]
MKLSAKIAGMVFLALSILDVVFLACGNESAPMFIKPFLMPSLAVAALLQLSPEVKGSRIWLLAAGLYFHTMGDIFLMFDDKDFIYFALGLGSFLIGHFFYLTILFDGIGSLRGFKELCCVGVPVILAPVLVSLFKVAWPFSAAVVAYAFTLMVVTGVGCVWHFRGRQFAWRIFFGGLFFIISDSLIAINAFAGLSFPFRGAVVMATYLFAEWLLVSGMVRYNFNSIRPKA